MNPACDVLNFEQVPWDNVVLVTPQNIMRREWNVAALRQHCAKTGNLLYMCQAEDTVGKDRHQPSMEEMTIIASLDPEDDLQRLHT